MRVKYLGFLVPPVFETFTWDIVTESAVSDCTEVRVCGVMAPNSGVVDGLSLSCLCPCTATHPLSANSQGQNFLSFISYNILQILITKLIAPHGLRKPCTVLNTKLVFTLYCVACVTLGYSRHFSFPEISENKQKINSTFSR